MEINIDEYVDGFRPDLMELVASWLQGVRFLDLMKMTKIFEIFEVGSMMSLLEELLRQLAVALKAIGELALSEKFGKAGERIKRDIVFAASLYL
eukprot:gene20957-27810_t